MRQGAEMMAHNIREPNRNSHEEYSTQKPNLLAQNIQNRPPLFKQMCRLQMLRNKNYFYNFWLTEISRNKIPIYFYIELQDMKF
jgi:hypothetical protein